MLTTGSGMLSLQRIKIQKRFWWCRSIASAIREAKLCWDDYDVACIHDHQLMWWRIINDHHPEIKDWLVFIDVSVASHLNVIVAEQSFTRSSSAIVHSFIHSFHSFIHSYNLKDSTMRAFPFFPSSLWNLFLFIYKHIKPFCITNTYNNIKKKQNKNYISTVRGELLHEN